MHRTPPTEPTREPRHCSCSHLTAVVGKLAGGRVGERDVHSETYNVNRGRAGERHTDSPTTFSRPRTHHPHPPLSLHQLQGQLKQQAAASKLSSVEGAVLSLSQRLEAALCHSSMLACVKSCVTLALHSHSHSRTHPHTPTCTRSATAKAIRTTPQPTPIHTSGHERERGANGGHAPWHAGARSPPFA